jgi:hypothetical protein
MGTRNLVAVINNKTPVIAQYGQWDGYPSGQGRTALAFCTEHLSTPQGREAFKEKLALCRWVTEEEIEDAVEGLVTELMQAVHVHYQADEDPDFGEYARDYTCAILALFHAPADPGGGEAEGAVRTAGAKLLTALERYGFPVSDAASTAAMSVEARDLHNAARRFKIAITSTKRAADEPAVTNGQ